MLAARSQLTSTLARLIVQYYTLQALQDRQHALREASRKPGHNERQLKSCIPLGFVCYRAEEASGAYQGSENADESGQAEAALPYRLYKVTGLDQISRVLRLACCMHYNCSLAVGKLPCTPGN
jgi:hypothetical protein